MYCPRCSQQQLSEDVSFCTRCGFQLGPVKELLASGGTGQQMVSQTVAQVVPPTGRWSRRRRVRLGAKLMFFSAVLFPMFLALAVAVDEPGPLVPPLMLFLAGLAWALYAWIFVEETIPAAPNTTTTFPGVTTARGVQSPSSPQSLSPGGFAELPVRHPNTAEIVQPPSVTERTTNLLKKTAD